MSAKKPAIVLVLITLFIDSIGFGIIIPVVPDLLVELTGDPSISESSLLGGLLLVTYAITQAICGPILSGLSDRFGRRPVILLALFGFSVDYLITYFTPTIAWLFLARFFAGIFGASFTPGGAYISDISTPENRAQNFGLVGVAFGLGFIFGPMLGGLIGSYGLRMPFLAAGGLALLNAIYAFFFLPESLKPENRREFDWRRANPFGTFKSLFQYPVIRQLFGALTLVYIAAHAIQSNWSFFTKELFGWGPKQIGTSITVVGIAVAVVQGGLVRVLLPKLGLNRSVYVGLMLTSLGMVLYAFASQSWMMYVFTIIYCLGGIAGPALQGLMSGIIPPNAQGELQGGFTSLMSITSIFGPLLMNVAIFPYFTSSEAPVYFPGSAMLLGAIFCLIASMIARTALKKNPPAVAA